MATTRSKKPADAGEKKPARKPAATTQLNSYDEELAALAQQGVRTEANSGGGTSNKISTKGGVFSFQGQSLGDTLRVVVLDHSCENAYYPEKFDPSDPQPPACYALGREEGDLAPHEKAEDPQSEACDGCPMNDFGSADGGRGAGKACKNTRRILVVLEESLEDMEEATVAMIQPPPTSVKHWGGYVKQLNSLTKRPPICFVTEVSLHPHKDNQYEMRFKSAGEVDRKVVTQLLERRRAVESMLFEPYGPRVEREKKPARSQKFARDAKKPAAKKPAPRGRK